MSLSGEYAPSPSRQSREQVREYEESGGTAGLTMRGQPVVILTSVGVRTGKLRKTPLMRIEHDGRYAVVASQGGKPRNPMWYHNLKANPHVELQDGPERREMTAHEAVGEERASWWRRALEVWPDYAEYQEKTDRVIPVLVLTPSNGRPPA